MFTGWTVIDFKTDRELGPSSDRYVAQVRMYAQATRRLRLCPREVLFWSFKKVGKKGRDIDIPASQGGSVRGRPPICQPIADDASSFRPAGKTNPDAGFFAEKVDVRQQLSAFNFMGHRASWAGRSKHPP